MCASNPTLVINKSHFIGEIFRFIYLLASENIVHVANVSNIRSKRYYITSDKHDYNQHGRFGP